MWNQCVGGLHIRHDIANARSSTPISHAFAHALASVLAYLRQVAEAISPDYQSLAGGDPELVSLWTRYEDVEHVLKALATLSGRVSCLINFPYIYV